MARPKKPVSVNKSEFAAGLAETLGIKKAEAKRMVEAVFDEIAAHLRSGHKVTLATTDGVFGYVGVRDVPAKKARMGTNPKDGTPMKLKAKPASKKVTFRASKALKDSI